MERIVISEYDSNSTNLRMLSWLPFRGKSNAYEAQPEPQMSTKQQIKIVQELRQNHYQQLAAKRSAANNKRKKVLPVTSEEAVPAIPNSRSRAASHESRESASSYDADLMSSSKGSKGGNVKKDERNLKLALTHPTIARFLKDYMVAQGTGDLLDFYLDVVEIRSTQRRFLYKEAYDMWVTLSKKYLIDGAPNPVRG